MIAAKYTDTNITHKEVIKFVKEQKNLNPNFKVIDLGGGPNGWTREIADFIADIGVSDTDKTKRVDLCDPADFNKLLAYVEKHGKFDYAICTHTLEDIYNPFLALENLPKIAKRGIITMPSIVAELSPVQSLGWRGYLHHRWIYDFRENKILIIPKITLFESLVKVKLTKTKNSEVRFDWSDNISYEVFMDHYLGPDTRTVIKEFSALIDEINQRCPGRFQIVKIYSRPRRLALRVVRFFKRLIASELP